MRHSFGALTILAAMAVASPAEAQAPSACPVAPAAAEAVGQAIHDFYAAERTGDGVRWRSLTTPDFLMFHEGKVMPPDEFVSFIERAHRFQQKHAAVWTMDVSDQTISVDCATALVTLTLHNIEDAPAAKAHPAYDETFLESFSLRKASNGDWKIAFWHSTKMPKPAAASDQGLFCRVRSALSVPSPQRGGGARSATEGEGSQTYGNPPPPPPRYARRFPSP